jgi:hypothetical protein
MARGRGREHGQTLVETALVLPLFLMVLVGIIALGIGVFYQQQVTNAAREAARFAAIHSATASCSTVGRLNPRSTMLPSSGSYARCDPVELGWPDMTAHARSPLAGLNPNAVEFAACWSGYQEVDPVTGAPDPAKYDAPPPRPSPGYDVIGPINSQFVPCKMDNDPPVDPTEDARSIECEPGLNATTLDTASAISEAPGRIVANTVTVFACFVWQPPLAGFLLIPRDVTLRAVVTEPIERQQ